MAEGRGNGSRQPPQHVRKPGILAVGLDAFLWLVIQSLHGDVEPPIELTKRFF